MRIGEVAEQAGVSVRALRYYEEQQLLPATRTNGGQRQYLDDAVERVRLIQQLYAAGLSSKLVREVLPRCLNQADVPDGFTERLGRRCSPIRGAAAPTVIPVQPGVPGHRVHPVVGVNMLGLIPVASSRHGGTWAPQEAESGASGRIRLCSSGAGNTGRGPDLGPALEFMQYPVAVDVMMGHLGVLSIGSVAEREGYPDQLYFSKVFRMKHRQNPSEYRRQTRISAP